ncbi:hypothetical protein TorRG33x02_118290, partial [Trema orientale]
MGPRKIGASADKSLLGIPDPKQEVHVGRKGRDQYEPIRSSNKWVKDGGIFKRSRPKQKDAFVK